jgi:hypothetical protein
MLQQTSNLFDGTWARFSPRLEKNLGIAPNQLWYCAAENRGALVIFRGNYDCSALNRAGIDYLYAAVTREEAPLAAGTVVLVTRSNEIVAERPVEDVKALLDPIEPRPGRFGFFYWVNDDFTADIASPTFLMAPAY